MGSDPVRTTLLRRRTVYEGLTPPPWGSFPCKQSGDIGEALDERCHVRQFSACGHVAPYDTATHRFNDGRCDPQGRLLAGSMNEARDASTAALYRLDADFSLTRVLSGMTISNGLAFSPDGRTMYHTDTPMQVVHAYDYDSATGTPTKPRVLVRFTAEGDRPDGAAVDSEGCYWSALYKGGKVKRIAPDGRVLSEHPLPAMCPTMCAFGGPDLKTLYVTSARQLRSADELARLPYSGGLFAMPVDVPGLPEPAFAG